MARPMYRRPGKPSPPLGPPSGRKPNAAPRSKPKQTVVPGKTKDDQMRSLRKKAKGADRSQAIEDTYGDFPIV